MSLGGYFLGLYMVSKRFLYIFGFLVIFLVILTLLEGFQIKFKDFAIFSPLEYSFLGRIVMYQVNVVQFWLRL